MAISVREPESKYTPAPEGLHVAACCDVVDLGMIEGSFGPKHMVEIHWQLDEENDQGERFVVRRRYTASLSEKANLRKDLETWRGKKFTPDELRGFDLEKLIGVGCQVQIVHKLSEQGKTFANVQAVTALGKGQKSPGVVDYVRQQDRPSSDGAAFADAIERAASEVPF